MSTLAIFEPALCCPTGVCGTDVDPVLVQFSADVQALQAAGQAVQRHSLSQDPAAFAAQPEVLRAMEAGMDRLPIVTLDGQVVSTGLYPSRAQMEQLLARAAVAQPAQAAPAARACCAPGQCC